MDLLLLPQKPWTLLQGYPRPAESKPHRPSWATTAHLHIDLVQYLMLHQTGVIQEWKASSSPPAPPSSAHGSPSPTLGAGHPQYLSGLGFTVPVMVMSSRGTSPACRGSSKGTFWETTGTWYQHKNCVKNPGAPLGTASPGPFRGQAKSATETLLMTEHYHRRSRSSVRNWCSMGSSWSS